MFQSRFLVDAGLQLGLVSGHFETWSMVLEHVGSLTRPDVCTPLYDVIPPPSRPATFGSLHLTQFENSTTGGVIYCCLNMMNCCVCTV